MLSSILPGIRHLRAPLTAGALWLLAVWLVAAPNLPPEGELPGPIATINELRQFIGGPSFAIAVAFLSYVFGTLSESLSAGLVRMYDSVDKRQQPEYDNVKWAPLTQHLSRWAVDLGHDLEAIDAHWRLHHFFERNIIGESIEDVFARVANELDALAAQLLVTNPDMFSHIDRIRAEQEFRFAVSPPLIVLALVTLILAGAALWSLVFAVVTLMVALLLWRDGIRRRWEWRAAMGHALLTKAVESPDLLRTTRWIEKYVRTRTIRL